MTAEQLKLAPPSRTAPLELIIWKGISVLGGFAELTTDTAGVSIITFPNLSPEAAISDFPSTNDCTRGNLASQAPLSHSGDTVGSFEQNQVGCQRPMEMHDNNNEKGKKSNN